MFGETFYNKILNIIALIFFYDFFQVEHLQNLSKERKLKFTINKDQNNIELEGMKNMMEEVKEIIDHHLEESKNVFSLLAFITPRLSIMYSVLVN